MSTHAPEIQALLDKAAITDVINNYLRAADRADIDLLKACYHDDAWEDHGGVYDGPASDYVAIMAKVLPKGGIMNHLATNIIIELDGDTAKGEHYILAYARMKKDGEKFDTLTLARAIDRFERRDGVWRIAKRRLVWEWNHEMPFAESWGRGMMVPNIEALVRGGKKPNDPLYAEA